MKIAARSPTKQVEQLREWFDSRRKIGPCQEEEDISPIARTVEAEENRTSQHDSLCAMCDRPLYGGGGVNAPGLIPERLIHRSCHRLVGKSAMTALRTLSHRLVQAGIISQSKIEKWICRRINYEVRQLLLEKGRKAVRAPARETPYRLIVVRQQKELLSSAIERMSQHIGPHQQLRARPHGAKTKIRVGVARGKEGLDIEARWRKPLEVLRAKMARRGTGEGDIPV